MTIVTSPQRGNRGEPTLRGDIDMVKAAVLYADEIEILGLAATMIHSIAMANGGPTALQMLPDLIRDAPEIAPDMPANWEQILPVVEFFGRMESVPAELAEAHGGISEFLVQADEMWDRAREEVLELVGGRELLPAVEAGLVKVADLGIGAKEAVLAAVGRSPMNSGDEIARWIEAISARLRDRRTRLLFDEESGDLIQSMLNEGLIARDEAGLRLAGSAAAGSGLIARLPTFNAAPLDELVDLRADLAPSLTQYRSAVTRFAKGLSGDLGSAATAELDELWEAEAVPAIQEIESLLREHTLVRELARQASADVRKFIGWTGSFYFGIGAVTGLADAAAAALAASPSAVQLARDVFYARRDVRLDVRRRDLFLLYEANHRLS